MARKRALDGLHRGKSGSRAFRKRNQTNERMASSSALSFLSLSRARFPLFLHTHISGCEMGLPGACCVLTGAGGCALEVELIALAAECGTFDDDVDIDVDVVEGTIKRGGAGGRVPPIPLPATPPV